MSTHNIYFRGKTRKIPTLYVEKSDLSGTVDYSFLSLYLHHVIQKG